METVCPYCERFFDVLDELEGTRTLCSFCDQVFTADRVFVLDRADLEGNRVTDGPPVP